MEMRVALAGAARISHAERRLIASRWGGHAVNRTVVFVKSLLAGGAATLTDFGVYLVLTKVLLASPHPSTFVALIAGATVNFVGNRRFAFHAHHGNLTRQAQRYIVVTLVVVGLNGLLFHLALQTLPSWPDWLLRFIIGNLVYLCFTYPMFRRIFHVHTPLPVPARVP